MLPLKWKIFRVISFLHMILAVMMGLYALYTCYNLNIWVRSTNEKLALLLVIIFSAVLSGNTSINLSLLEKFFPNKVPGKKIRIFSGILFVLASIAIFFVLIGAASTIYEISSKRYANSLQYTIAYLIVSGITMLGLSGCYILWAQVSLRKAIRRNHEATLNSFMESTEP